MARKNHTVEEVLRSLSKKGVSVKSAMPNGPQIYLNGVRNNQSLGNGSWGKIDFLCKKGFILSN